MSSQTRASIIGAHQRAVAPGAGTGRFPCALSLRPSAQEPGCGVLTQLLRLQGRLQAPAQTQECGAARAPELWHGRSSGTVFLEPDLSSGLGEDKAGLLPQWDERWTLGTWGTCFISTPTIISNYPLSSHAGVPGNAFLATPWKDPISTGPRFQRTTIPLDGGEDASH